MAGCFIVRAKLVYNSLRNLHCPTSEESSFEGSHDFTCLREIQTNGPLASDLINPVFFLGTGFWLQAVIR